MLTLTKSSRGFSLKFLLAFIMSSQYFYYLGLCHIFSARTLINAEIKSIYIYMVSV